MVISCIKIVEHQSQEISLIQFTNLNQISPVLYSFRNKKKQLIQKTTYMGPRGIMLSEKSQSSTVTYYMITFMQHAWKDKVIENCSVVAR